MAASSTLPEENGSYQVGLVAAQFSCQLFVLLFNLCYGLSGVHGPPDMLILQRVDHEVQILDSIRLHLFDLYI